MNIQIETLRPEHAIHGADEFELAKLTVRSEYRGQGIARDLVRRCIAFAQQRGADRRHPSAGGMTLNSCAVTRPDRLAPLEWQEALKREPQQSP